MDEGLMEIYSEVQNRLKKKLRHNDFKILLWVPDGYRGNEKAEDVVDITVNTKDKTVRVEFKDWHEIVFHYDPKGRYNEWAFGSRSVTPEEAKILNKLQEARDKLIDAHRRGDMSDKDFETAMEKESKKGERHLRKRWKEINKGER